MSYSKILSKALQGTSVDIVKAFRMISLLKNTLQDARDNITAFNKKWYNEAVTLAEAVGVDPEVPRTVGIMLHRSNVPATTTCEFYERNVTIPLLDHLIQELDTRFCDETKRATQVLQLVPSVIKSDAKLESEKFNDLINLYMDDLPSPLTLDTELHTWEMKWKNAVGEVPNSAAKALKAIDKTFFPNLHTLFRIFCTLPVTSCECERTISGLRKLKSYMRTTMNQERMNGLLMLHMHYSKELDKQEIINEYARRNPRRMELVDILS